MKLRFVKMEGAGNDYVYVDGVHQTFPLARGAALARTWSDRHFGIGGDGLIVLLPADDADVRMAMWNGDGSRGAMCGNGLRCVAKLAHDLGLAAGPMVRVATDVGRRDVELLFEGKLVIGARASLGAVQVAITPERVTALGRTFDLHRGSAGNPHAVLFADGEPDTWSVAQLGAALQSHASFPDGVNVEFVRARRDGSLDQRTFERGSGETLACGTGAGVAAATAIATGRVRGPRVVVHLRGGDLVIEQRATDLVLEGPARSVFAGEVELPRE